MPHKHKRQKLVSDELFDLPPTQRAKPLSSGKKNDAAAIRKSKAKKKGPSADQYGADDTPRAFARLLEFQRTGKGMPRGLDEGKPKTKAGKKRKLAQVDEEGAGAAAPENVPTSAANDDGPGEQSEDVQGAVADAAVAALALRIQPGERLSEFGARVNQALPISGLTRKGKAIAGVKEKVTKHNKRLGKMQDQWREDEAKLREKEEEEREVAEEEWEEKVAGMDKESRALLITSAGGKKGKKSKKGKLIGEVDEDDDDPWAVLKQRREAPKGLHDVVQAPPKFGRLPKVLFKGAKVGDVPKAAGSLRRREELGETRAEIIKSYRSMMAQNRVK